MAGDVEVQVLNREAKMGGGEVIGNGNIVAD